MGNHTQHWHLRSLGLAQMTRKAVSIKFPFIILPFVPGYEEVEKALQWSIRNGAYVVLPVRVAEDRHQVPRSVGPRTRSTMGSSSAPLSRRLLSQMACLRVCVCLRIPSPYPPNADFPWGMQICWVLINHPLTSNLWNRLTFVPSGRKEIWGWGARAQMARPELSGH